MCSMDHFPIMDLINMNITNLYCFRLNSMARFLELLYVADPYKIIPHTSVTHHNPNLACQDDATTPAYVTVQ